MRALIGRTLTPADETNPRRGRPELTTRGRRHFNSDPTIVGKALEFRTGALLAPMPPRLLTVVGVMPADFEIPTGHAATSSTPITLDPGRRGRLGVMMLAPARARRVRCEAAIEEANVMGSAMRPPWPADRAAAHGAAIRAPEA